MLRQFSRRRFLLSGFAGLFSAISPGCGTILHPERRGQPAGPLDWKIVALDAIGLLFFFVPGVIAFAVDFSNGTIYLPASGYGYGAADRGDSPRELVSVPVPADRLSLDEIGQVVSRHCRRDVKLLPGEYQTQPLESLDGFWPARDRLAQQS